MKNWPISLLSMLCIPTYIYSQSLPPFTGNITIIPNHIKKQMRLYTWRQNCPIPLAKLRYLNLRYYGYDNQSHTGALIVHQALAKDVLTIFKKLYKAKFPIQSMLPMYKFKGNDLASMHVNNTSAFNCRYITKHPGLYSQHSFGRAIDINPRTNPYVAGKTILPQNGKPFIKRAPKTPGIIIHNNLIYKIFIAHGFNWGGNWYNSHDYQHFEKRAG